MSVDPLLEYEIAPPAADRDTALPPSASRAVEALSDVVAGFSRAWMWSALAYQDIRLRYRGSLFGPFWITLTNLVLLVAMGTIYAALFKIETSTYIPFLMTGLLVWQFLSTIANESCSTFIAAQDVIQQVPLPFSIQAYRTVYRNLLVLAHNAVIIPFGLILFRVPVTWRVLEIVPGLFVLCINGLWISLLLGAVSTRFRDVPPIVANAVQVVFFVTPIFWPIDAVGDLEAAAYAESGICRDRCCARPAPGPSCLGSLLADTARLHQWLAGPSALAFSSGSESASPTGSDSGRSADHSNGFHPMPSLHLRHVGVEFPIYQGSSRSLKKILISGTTKGNLARDALDRINVRALSDVSFDVENGERFRDHRSKRRR